MGVNLDSTQEPRLASGPALKDTAALESENFLREFSKSFCRNKMAVAGAVTILVITSIAILAPFVAPHDPYQVNLANQFAPPSPTYLLGTDMFGRDVLSRIIYGARISLLIGLVPTFISLAIGTFLGLVSGYYGGKTDYLIMRLADIVLAFPSLLLAMVVMYTLGATLLNIFIALSAVRWARMARVVRAETMSLKEKEFVEGARAVGVSNSTIIIRHIFPNCVPSLLVLFTLQIPDAILSEATLSFLGVGAQPPASSWGLMVSAGKEFLMPAPAIAIAPGVAILIVVLAFNFLGDGIRDAIDPYMKQ